MLESGRDQIHTQPRLKANQHIPTLDGVRGLAALMVMAFHWCQGFSGSLGPLEPARKFAVFGQAGVDLFFVLSGFLITRILLNTLDRPGYFQNFYARRALRIFPLYYGFLIFFYLGWSAWFPSAHPSGAPWYFAYLQNIQATFGIAELSGPGHFWSLAVEEHFYLLWPFLIWCVPFRRLPWLVAVTIITSVVCRIVLQHYGFGVFYFTFCRLDGLAVGAMLAWLEKRDGGLLVWRKQTSAGLIILLPITGLLWIATTGKGLAWMQAFKFLLLALVFGAVVCGVASGFWGRPVRRIFESRTLRWIGLVSYGSYVFHPFCFELVSRFLSSTSATLNFVAGFALTFGVAALSFYALERPFLSLKDRFSHRVPAAQECVASVNG